MPTSTYPQSVVRRCRFFYPSNSLVASGRSHADHGYDDWRRWYLLLVAQLSSRTTGGCWGAKVLGWDGCWWRDDEGTYAIPVNGYYDFNTCFKVCVCAYLCTFTHRKILYIIDISLNKSRFVAGRLLLGWLATVLPVGEVVLLRSLCTVKQKQIASDLWMSKPW